MDSAAVGPQRPAPCVMYLLFITQPLFVFVFVYNCVSACLVLPAALFFRILYVMKALLKALSKKLVTVHEMNKPLLCKFCDGYFTKSFKM